MALLLRDQTGAVVGRVIVESFNSRSGIASFRVIRADAATAIATPSPSEYFHNICIAASAQRGLSQRTDAKSG